MKTKPKLLAKGEGPVKGMLNLKLGCVRGEDLQEVVQIVAHLSWEVSLHNPVESFAKQVEDVGC